MLVIGHRGVAGLELENTLASLRKAKALGLEAIEFDVRLTKDRKVVLCHDPDLLHMCGQAFQIDEQTLASLQKVILKNGETIATLDQALQAVGDMHLFIDVKSPDMQPELLAILDKYPEVPGVKITLTTFCHDLAATVKKQRPDMTILWAEHFSISKLFGFRTHPQADGVTLSKWLLNPFTYYALRRRGLGAFTYTVNSRLTGWLIKHFYPQTAIYSDHPERFIHH